MEQETIKVLRAVKNTLDRAEKTDTKRISEHLDGLLRRKVVKNLQELEARAFVRSEAPLKGSPSILAYRLTERGLKVLRELG